MRNVLLLTAMAICLHICGCQQSPPSVTHPPETGAVLTIDLPDGETPVSTYDQIAWSPDGKTLGYLLPNSFHTELPKRTYKLPVVERDDEYGDYKWGSFRWSGEGDSVLIRVYGRAIVLDIETGSISDAWQGEGSYWWLGNSLCYTKWINEPNSKTVQKWKFGSQTKEFPRGFTFAGASSDGKAIIGINHVLHAKLPPEEEPFTLLVFDDDGNVRWMRDLDPFGRSDLLDFAPHISWNELRSIAALTLDVSGAGTYMTSVENETGQWRLRLVDENSDLSWSGVPRWLDDRYLFCPITLASSYAVDRERDIPRLTVFDTETGVLAVVYESAKMFDAVASEHYVAIFEAIADNYRIVVSAWRRDADGRIISPEYLADDVPRNKSNGSPDWDRLEIPPLKFVPGKHSKRLQQH